MSKYYLEVTDLFCGELNYSFVQRYEIDSVSIRGAISKLSRHLGLNFRKHFDNVYHSTTKLTGVYIEEYDECGYQCYIEKIGR